jgi:hypothetical protein
MVNVTYLRLQIAVNNTMMAHQSKGAEHLGRKSPDQCGGETNKSICFDQLIKVDAEQLHCNTEMVTEIEMLCHLDDMVFFIGIL